MSQSRIFVYSSPFFATISGPRTRFEATMHFSIDSTVVAYFVEEIFQCVGVSMVYGGTPTS